HGGQRAGHRFDAVQLGLKIRQRVFQFLKIDHRLYAPTPMLFALQKTGGPCNEIGRARRYCELLEEVPFMGIASSSERRNGHTRIWIVFASGVYYNFFVLIVNLRKYNGLTNGVACDENERLFHY